MTNEIFTPAPASEGDVGAALPSNEPTPSGVSPHHEPAPSNTEAAADEKQKVRSAFRAARAALAPDTRKKANKAILARLVASTAFSKAKTVLIYAANSNEVNLDDVISSLTRAGKRVAVPRLTKTPGVMTLWAVRHVDALIEKEGAKVRTPDVTRAIPIEPKDVDLVLVPGVAFTATLGRLGQGGGYYDRLLPWLRPEAKRIGVCFDIQIAHSLPVEANDVPMHAVITEAQVYGESALLEPAPVALPIPSGLPTSSTSDANAAETPVDETGSQRDPTIPTAQLSASNP